MTTPNPSAAKRKGAGRGKLASVGSRGAEIIFRADGFWMTGSVVLRDLGEFTGSLRFSLLQLQKRG